MTDAEINIAIAENHGYAWYARWTGERGTPEKYATFSLKPENHGHESMVGKAGESFKITEHESALLFRREFHHPNYVSDLNAMHEAEKIQGFHDLEYRQLLTWICDHDWQHAKEKTQRNPIHATARQRAEAFLRTIGKWKE